MFRKWVKNEVGYCGIFTKNSLFLLNMCLLSDLITQSANCCEEIFSAGKILNDEVKVIVYNTTKEDFLTFKQSTQNSIRDYHLLNPSQENLSKLQNRVGSDIINNSLNECVMKKYYAHTDAEVGLKREEVYNLYKPIVGENFFKTVLTTTVAASAVLLGYILYTCSKIPV